jgi:hypothetical protein
MAILVIPHNSVADRELHPVIVKLKAWRRKNKLSQRQAVEIMKARGYPVLLGELQRWEVGMRRPRPLVAKALEAFLDKHPKIPAEDVPKFGRWRKKD